MVFKDPSSVNLLSPAPRSGSVLSAEYLMKENARVPLGAG